MEKNKIKFKNIIGDLYYNKNNNSKLILFCPGLPAKANFQDLAKKYIEKGFVFINIKYPGTWESYGDFKVKNCKESVIELVNEIKNNRIKDIFENDVDLKINEIYFMGHSFGGSVALCSGSELDIKGIIALAPVIDYSKHNSDKKYNESDLNNLFLFIKKGFENVIRNIDEVEWKIFIKSGMDLNATNYSHILRQKNILLIHGENDTSVNVNWTKEFFTSIENPNSKLIITADNHSDVKYNFDKIIEWINRGP